MCEYNGFPFSAAFTVSTSTLSATETPVTSISNEVIVFSSLAINVDSGCVSAIGAVNELAPEDMVEVFPNPSQGNFTITCEKKITAIEITGLLGEQIQKWAAGSMQLANNSQVVAIDLSLKPVGIYFAHIRTEEGMIMKKIVVVEK
jgi:hypothetical protein